MPKYDGIADTQLAAGEAEDDQPEDEEREGRVSMAVNGTMLFNYLRIHRHSIHLCPGSRSTDRDVRSSKDQATRVAHAR